MFVDGDVVIYTRVKVRATGNPKSGVWEVPEPDLRMVFFRHVRDDKLHKAEFTYENHDSRLRIPRLGRYVRDGNLIEFTYGYVNDLSRKYTYIMKGFEGFRQVKVTCYPWIETIDTPCSRTWPKMTYSQIAHKIAQEMGLKPDIQETTCVQKSVKQNNESNAKLLERIAKELNFELGFNNGILRFGPRRYTQKAKFWFIHAGGSLTGDIYDFDPKQNTFGVPSNLERVVVDPKTGKVTYEQASNAQTKRDLLGSKWTPITSGFNGDVPQADGARGNGGISDVQDERLSDISHLMQRRSMRNLTGSVQDVLPPVAKAKATRGPTGQKIVKSAQTPANGASPARPNDKCPQYYREPPKKRGKEDCTTDDRFKTFEDNVIEAHMQLQGQPLLDDKIVIAVAQVDPKWDGAWYVQSVVDEIGIDIGFTTQCDLMRNSIGDPSPLHAKQGAGKAYGSGAGTQLGVTAGLPASQSVLTQPPGANASALKHQALPLDKETDPNIELTALIKRRELLTQLRNR